MALGLTTVGKLDGEPADLRGSLGSRSTWTVMALGSLLAVAYAARVPRWLPYDEPAHWANVVFVADHLRMPILGQPGSSYESQMGPVAYFYDAFWLKGWLLVGGAADSGFWLVRLAGLLPLLGFFLVLRALVARSIPTLPASAVTGAAALVAFNPMFLAMAMSVQNDVIALALGMSAMYVAVGLAGTPTTGKAMLVGVLGGLAVLTKLTAWPVLPVIAAGWLLSHRTKALSPVSAMTVMASAVCGWWFIVNLSRYGDPSGRAGVEAMGFTWGPAPVDGLRTLLFLVREFAGYLTLPVEYWRNSVNAPAWVETVTALLLLTMSIQGVRRWAVSGVRGNGQLIIAVSVVGVGVWFVLFYMVQSSPVRFAYIALSAWSVVVAAALTSVRVRYVAATSLALLHVWCLTVVGGVHFP